MNQTELLEACALSKEFFFENFYMIPDIINGGLTKFTLRDAQKEILAQITDDANIIGLKARQIGWTTLAVANAVHETLFNEWRPWKFISRNEKAAQDMVGKATLAYYRLPTWMRKALPKLESETQGGLVFANGSRIEAEPATGSSFRGDAVHGLLMDECAFMEYAEEIWGAAEAGVYGTRMLFSTANGMGNFFHDVWLDSQRPNSAWNGIFFPWDVVPERDEEWYELKKKQYRGREWLFFQEYPSSPEEAFAKSGRVAFGSDLIADNYQEMEPHAVYDFVIGQGPVEVANIENAQIPITVWVPPNVVREEGGRPKYKPNYVVGCDVAEGLEHGDFTYVTVFDVNTGEQCASSKSAIPVSYLDELLNWFGEYYLTALMVVERNNAGILPIDRLYRDHWYPRMYRADRFAERSADRSARYGWVTNGQTKPKMVNDFVYALAEGHVLLHDPDFKHEATVFVADGKGGYAATSTNHDDVIMGSLIAWQGILDSHKYEILWVDNVVTAPTHDDLDALFWAPDKSSNEDFLDRPIGQPEPQRAKKSVILLPANYGK